jgi:hypothetical protein
MTEKGQIQHGLCSTRVAGHRTTPSRDDTTGFALLDRASSSSAAAQQPGQQAELAATSSRQAASSSQLPGHRVWGCVLWSTSIMAASERH